jgi:hypothetical protein
VDGWPQMNRLKRDLTFIGGAVIGAATLLGAAVGWVGYQLFEHLHHEGRSDHFRR